MVGPETRPTGPCAAIPNFFSGNIEKVEALKISVFQCWQALLKSPTCFLTLKQKCWDLTPCFQQYYKLSKAMFCGLPFDPHFRVDDFASRKLSTYHNAVYIDNLFLCRYPRQFWRKTW
jgi:hypothetical protein